MASVDNDRLRKVQLNVRNGRTNINTDISNIYESGGDDNFNTISVNFSSIHLIHKGDLIDLEYIYDIASTAGITIKGDSTIDETYFTIERITSYLSLIHI